MSTDTEAPVALVIDDDAIQRQLTAQALQNGGFHAEQADCAEQALEHLETLRPAVILLDIVMPGMDGFALCTVLRERAPLRNVPIVMMTGLDDVESIDRAYEVGATDFITKPFNWSILCHRVRYILRASQTTQALAKSEERYALAALGANDGLWDWDIDKARVYFSPRWKQILGYADEDIGTGIEEWLGRVHKDDVDKVRAALDEHLAGNSTLFCSEHRVRHCDDSWHWVLCRGVAQLDDSGEARRMAGSLSDISQRKLVEEQLRHDALHDGLTQLPNRALFLDRVAYCINSLSRRSDYMFAVIFIDLDRFKTINDSLGHLVGDELLREVSRRIKTCLRTADTLARLGGDEFSILCDDIDDVADLVRIIERIQRELVEPISLNGQEVIVTASIGITLSTLEYHNPEDMLRDADTAMYGAKSGGRNCYKIFDSRMHTLAVNTLRLEAELRVAMERSQFEVYYQPIVSLSDGHTAGFEALLRWNHPARGLTTPDNFLDLAEETGIIVPVGRWLLEKACRQLREWQLAYPSLCDTYVSVNVSSREFMQPDLLEHLDATLQASGLSGEHLRIELTENVLIKSNQAALDVLNQLIERGVRLSLDDFGTGYSSFNYLHRFPFNTVKIDRSFINELDTASNSQEIVRAIIELAHNLGLNVVAEGSETDGEINTLRDLNCEYGQGHAYARPMSHETLEELLASGSDIARGPQALSVAGKSRAG